MTREDKIKDVLDRIHKFDPSILNLEEGCRVTHIKSGAECVIVRFNDEFDMFSIYSSDDDYVEEYSRVELLDQYVSIGRDLHLEDVMMALEYTDGIFNIDYCGEFFDYVTTDDYENSPVSKLQDVGVTYDLKKPFCNQSDSFYDFMIRRLKNLSV